MMGKSSPGDLTKRLTKASCAAACLSYKRGYDFAGVLDGQYCFCGTAAQMGQNASFKRPTAECQVTPCRGDSHTMCGAKDRLLAYNYTVTAQKSPWEPH